MWGLGEALGLQLTINSPLQRVGEAPIFTLIGAPPGATVLWSSYKDGIATGEFNSGYNQTVEANGTARLTGGNWTADQVGLWTKEVLIQDAAGNNNRAMIQFRVVPASVTAVPSTTPVAASGQDWLSTPLFSIGTFEVTPLTALVGFGALYFLTKKR
jgi:hypothetical protein